MLQKFESFPVSKCIEDTTLSTPGKAGECGIPSFSGSISNRVHFQCHGSDPSASVLAYWGPSDRSSQTPRLDRPSYPCHSTTISQCHLYPFRDPLECDAKLGSNPTSQLVGREALSNGFTTLFLIQSKAPSISSARSLGFRPAFFGRSWSTFLKSPVGSRESSSGLRSHSMMSSTSCFRASLGSRNRTVLICR